MRATTWIFAVSLGAHAALGFGVGTLRAKPAGRGATAISMAESKKKPPPPKSDSPPPPPKAPDPSPATRRAAKAKAAEAKPAPDAPTPKAAANAAAMDALPDFGLSLSGGVGPGGLAVPAQIGGPAGPSGPAKVAAKAAPAMAKPPGDDCGEPLIKPKPESVPQPSYTPAAREASVQGRVRVEVSVDASGHVTSVRLLSGLGYGLDEAALAAARSATFSAATRCGKPTATTFVIAMRFSL